MKFLHLGNKSVIDNKKHIYLFLNSFGLLFKWKKTFLQVKCIFDNFEIYLFLLQEREEESKRLKQQKITEEAEQRRLASEYEQRRSQRIRKEIEERELEEAQAMLQEAEKRGKKKGKKPVLEGVSSITRMLPFF